MSTIDHRTVPVMTAAQPGWSAVLWEPRTTEPTEANFLPVIAWGLMEEVERDDDGDVVDRNHWPIAYVVEDGQLTTMGLPDHDTFLLGFSGPDDGPDDVTGWNEMAVDAWRRWRDELAEKRGKG